MSDVNGLRLRARCGTGTLEAVRRVTLAPDKCTFHQRWRRERSGHVRCFKRLLGTDWLSEAAPILELSKVHAFTGVQTLLKSAHEPLRRRVAAVTGGCLAHGGRPNVHGAILATMMRPAPAVLSAVRWALAQQQRQQQRFMTRGSRQQPWVPPQIALHVRAMSDHRARNLTLREQENQMQNALLCVQRSLGAIAAEGGGKRRGAAPLLSALVVSSSPELRALLVRQLKARTKRLIAEAKGRPARERVAEPHLLPLIFDWRLFVKNAPAERVAALSTSESAAAKFCAGVNATESFRCNRSAHLRDWGPEPHWVAVVELLLVAAITHVVVGAGYPYFKVCNTFAQIGAALADAAPEWLCKLGPASKRGHLERQCSRGPRGVRLICASRVFSTDWGSSMWRTLNATAKRGSDAVVDCAAPTCMATPLQPELWDGLKGERCPLDGDTFEAGGLLFGSTIKPLSLHH